MGKIRLMIMAIVALAMFSGCTGKNLQLEGLKDWTYGVVTANAELLACDDNCTVVLPPVSSSEFTISEIRIPTQGIFKLENNTTDVNVSSEPYIIRKGTDGTFEVVDPVEVIGIVDLKDKLSLFHVAIPRPKSNIGTDTGKTDYILQLMDALGEAKNNLRELKKMIIN
jgi:hypothetical protein